MANGDNGIAFIFMVLFVICICFLTYTGEFTDVKSRDIGKINSTTHDDEWTVTTEDGDQYTVKGKEKDIPYSKIYFWDEKGTKGDREYYTTPEKAGGDKEFSLYLFSIMALLLLLFACAFIEEPESSGDSESKPSKSPETKVDAKFKRKMNRIELKITKFQNRMEEYNE